MQTNFFENIATLQITGTLKIVINSTTENRLIVSVLLDNEKCGDEARKIIPPLNLNGTPTELDEGFFTSISTPLKNTSELFVNMEAYLKAQEEAKKQSKMEQDKNDRERKQTEERKKKYEAQMKKVTELETQEKYGEAIAQLPKAENYPEQKDAITAKKDELWNKRNNKENALF